MRNVDIDGTPTAATLTLPAGGIPETGGSGNPLVITPDGAFGQPADVATVLKSVEPFIVG